MRIRSKLVLGILMVGFLALPIVAAAQQSSVQISTQINPSCILTAVSGMDFGAYNPTLDNVSNTASNTISLKCIRLSPNVRVSLDEGQNPAPGSNCSRPMRRLKSSTGQYLSYEINYSLSGSNLPLGCEPGVSERLVPSSSFVRSNTWVNLTQYGLIPSGQDVRAGVYTDTVRVSVHF